MTLRRSAFRGAVGMLAALAAACGTADERDASASSLEVGTGGAAAFEPVRDGDTLFLAMGCQGLQHIWISLRVRNFEPNPAIVSLALNDAATGAALQEGFEARLRFNPVDGEDAAELRGIQLVVPDAPAVLDRDVELSAQVRETNSAASVNAALQVRIEWGDEVCGS